uniref:helix-turn-helix domain-containing protein n=1 Tax=Streptomyces virginiae TaxID=1961 RepID=UPI002F91A523
MGRPELPVDETVRERALLAKALRRIRRKARLSYDELAARTGLSAATLKRAASGKSVPSEDTVKAIATACGQDPEILHWYWLDARIADRGRFAQLRKPALPQFINGRRELSAALEYFYEEVGAPPLRRLTELAGGTHLLPVSSAARIVSRQALPASRQQMIAFLTACGHPGHLMGLWGDAFEEITRGSDTDDIPARARLYAKHARGMEERSGRSAPMDSGQQTMRNGIPRFTRWASVDSAGAFPSAFAGS